MMSTHIIRPTFGVIHDDASCIKQSVETFQHAKINRLRQAHILIIGDCPAGGISHVDVDLLFLVSLRTP